MIWSSGEQPNLINHSTDLDEDNITLVVAAWSLIYPVYVFFASVHACLNTQACFTVYINKILVLIKKFLLFWLQVSVLSCTTSGLKYWNAHIKLGNVITYYILTASHKAHYFKTRNNYISAKTRRMTTIWNGVAGAGNRHASVHKHVNRIKGIHR
jgi:hypothetical protein